jgi:hypothetical protein
MIRIDADQTQLTRTENKALDLFYEALDHGYNVADAVAVARRAHPRLSAEFYEWLVHPRLGS